MSTPLLSVKNLEVTYLTGSTKAVKGVSFEIQRATCLAIVGESGSGKSTTALAIARLLENSANTKASEILFEGKNILNASKKELRRLRRERIGIVFQDQLLAGIFHAKLEPSCLMLLTSPSDLSDAKS